MNDKSFYGRQPANGPRRTAMDRPQGFGLTFAGEVESLPLRLGLQGILLPVRSLARSLLNYCFKRNNRELRSAIPVDISGRHNDAGGFKPRLRD